MMANELNDIDIRIKNLQENLKIIQERISLAAQKSGRNAEDITLLAATKTIPAEIINKAIDLGVTNIGENRVQELMEKYEDLNLENCSCHFIGHLQTNKVKYLVKKVDLIQSVGNARLAKEISRISENQNVNTDVLIEVNIGKEENKSGVMPENLWELYEEVAGFSAISIRGLMCIPPICEDKNELMDYFLKMNDYFVDIQRKKLDNKNNSMILSMGMSSDYYEAILCGSTMVRVGSSLFGSRNYT